MVAVNSLNKVFIIHRLASAQVAITRLLKCNMLVLKPLFKLVLEIDSWHEALFSLCLCLFRSIGIHYCDLFNYMLFIVIFIFLTNLISFYSFVLQLLNQRCFNAFDSGSSILLVNLVLQNLLTAFHVHQNLISCN